MNSPTPKWDPIGFDPQPNDAMRCWTEQWALHATRRGNWLGVKNGGAPKAPKRLEHSLDSRHSIKNTNKDLLELRKLLGYIAATLCIEQALHHLVCGFIQSNWCRICQSIVVVAAVVVVVVVVGVVVVAVVVVAAAVVVVVVVVVITTATTTTTATATATASATATATTAATTSAATSAATTTTSSKSSLNLGATLSLGSFGSLPNQKCLEPQLLGHSKKRAMTERRLNAALDVASHPHLLFGSFRLCLIWIMPRRA